MNISNYIVKSLELHLFFGRIMKEHALFLRAGFTPAAPAFSKKAECFLKEFEGILSEAVRLSDGAARDAVLNSGEVVTQFTALAEKQTECLTGVPINKEITARTLCLQAGQCRCGNAAAVGKLNRRALKALNGLIDFKESILSCVRQGELFTLNYPLLIEHILREAKLYRKYVELLERTGDLSDCTVREDECFWNQIMMEHAEFIRGLLDPCEKELIGAAEGFAEDFCELLETCRNAHGKTVSGQTLEKTRQFRDFKAAGTQGIQQNKIRSIILPLLADHVLREANHFIRLLEA